MGLIIYIHNTQHMAHQWGKIHGRFVTSKFDVSCMFIIAVLNPVLCHKWDKYKNRNQLWKLYEITQLRVGCCKLGTPPMNKDTST